METTVNDPNFLSIVLSLLYVRSQTVHGDSRKKGGSLLLAAGRRQYLIILLNGFQTMRSVERMLPKRDEAVKYIREKILGHAGEQWVTRHFNSAAEIWV